MTTGLAIAVDGIGQGSLGIPTDGLDGDLGASVTVVIAYWFEGPAATLGLKVLADAGSLGDRFLAPPGALGLTFLARPGTLDRRHLAL